MLAQKVSAKDRCWNSRHDEVKGVGAAKSEVNCNATSGFVDSDLSAVGSSQSQWWVSERGIARRRRQQRGFAASVHEIAATSTVSHVQEATGSGAADSCHYCRLLFSFPEALKSATKEQGLRQDLAAGP